jgi:hypothetical protein
MNAIYKITNEELYESFNLRYTKKNEGLVINADCRHDFPNMTLEEAREAFVKAERPRLERLNELIWKVEMFERWLQLCQGVEPVQSNVSESRYYYFDGYKYRISHHVYPTGSMTDETLKVVDLCADKELIDEVLNRYGIKELFEANYPGNK